MDEIPNPHLLRIASATENPPQTQNVEISSLPNLHNTTSMTRIFVLPKTQIASPPNIVLRKSRLEISYVFPS
ncbi:hypothetical protein LguiA_021436 [Lonicera macranthoides]